MTVNLIKFVYAGGEYRFPSQVSVDVHQGGSVAQTTRLPRIDGGYDQLGSGPAPLAIGDVQATWWLDTARTGQSTQEMRDEVMRMVDAGAGTLVADFGGQIRRMRVRTNNISMNIDNRRVAHRLQQVQANFQGANPRWEAYPSGVYLEDGLRLDTGLTLPAARTIEFINTGDVVTLTHPYEVPAPITFVFGGSADPVTNLQIRHFNKSNKFINGFIYSGTIAVGDTLVIDGERQTVQYWVVTMVSSGFSVFTELVRDGFFRLQPGVNTLKISGIFGASDLQMQMFYNDGWR